MPNNRPRRARFLSADRHVCTARQEWPPWRVAIFVRGCFALSIHSGRFRSHDQCNRLGHAPGRTLSARNAKLFRPAPALPAAGAALGRGSLNRVRWKCGADCRAGHQNQGPRIMPMLLRVPQLGQCDEGILRYSLDRKVMSGRALAPPARTVLKNKRKQSRRSQDRGLAIT